MGVRDGDVRNVSPKRTDGPGQLRVEDHDVHWIFASLDAADDGKFLHVDRHNLGPTREGDVGGSAIRRDAGVGLGRSHLDPRSLPPGLTFERAHEGLVEMGHASVAGSRWAKGGLNRALPVDSVWRGSIVFASSTTLLLAPAVWTPTTAPSGVTRSMYGLLPAGSVTVFAIRPVTKLTLETVSWSRSRTKPNRPSGVKWTSQGNLPVLTSVAISPRVEVEDDEGVLAGDIDPGSLPVGCEHEVVSRTPAASRECSRHADRPRVDRDGLYLVVRKVIGPDMAPIPEQSSGV